MVDLFPGRRWISVDINDPKKVEVFCDEKLIGAVARTRFSAQYSIFCAEGEPAQYKDEDGQFVDIRPVEKVRVGIHEKADVKFVGFNRQQKVLIFLDEAGYPCDKRPRSGRVKKLWVVS